MTNSKHISVYSDSELLSEYRQSKNKDLLGEVFRRYTGFTLAVCLKYLQHKHLAEDAVMQIFEKLLQDLEHTEVLNLKPWLHVVAKNHCLMHLRKHKFQTESIDDSNFFDSKFMESGTVLHPDNEETLVEPKLEKLEEEINKLKKEQRECISLFFLQEKCYKEIEEITGYDYKQIKSFIQNGKRNLKNMLITSIVIIMMINAFFTSFINN